MFGLTIIRKAELKRLKEETSKKDEVIKNLEEQVKSLTRKRNGKGQFVKA
ncbi:MAG: hypothetical protein ACK5M3_01145 [Dysgonomonas sp.]